MRLQLQDCQNNQTAEKLRRFLCRSLGGLFLTMCVCAVIEIRLPHSQAQDLSVPGADASQTVIDIRIRGNETIPESVILQKIQIQPRRVFTERMLLEDHRSLMGTRWFFSVSVDFEDTPEGKVLFFTVHERPIVQSVTFIGNDHVKTKMLEAWTGLKSGSPFDHVANADAVSRIEQEYKEKGYYFVKVVLEKGANPSDRQVVFRINEGPKVRVQHRTFEGNRFWGAGDLRKNLASKEALLGFFGGFYHPETLPQDVEALKQFYHNVGFFDVEVDVQPRFSPDKSDVNLHFTIKEGTRYRIRSIRYQGNQVIPTQQLQQDTQLREGQDFNSVPMAKDVRKMLKQYGELGHYFASVVPSPHFTETTGIVDIVYEIDEDRPRYIRNIDVAYDGDYPHTKQTVVWDRMQVFPGDLANPDLIRRSRSRLGGSGLFEPNIMFDVVPVEPENSSFASRSRTYRAQSPDEYDTEAWTNEFAEFTRQAARLSTIGSYPWLPEESADSSKGTSPEGNQQPTKSKLNNAIDSKPIPPSISPTAANEAPRQWSYATVSSSAIDQRTMGGHSRLFASNPAASKEITKPSADSSAWDSHGTAINQSASKPPVESLVTGFRSVHPGDVFQAESSEFLTSNLPNTNSPIIRAQSPDAGYGSPYYDPAPGPRDSVLEGSPYRNQFQAMPPGWVDINVRATEGRTGRLMFGAGVNSDAGLVGSFVWDESNFDLFRPPQTFADIIEGRAWRGGGQRFRLEAAPGNQVSRYTLSWTDPYFMYSDYSLTLSGFYFNRFYPDWQEDRLGGRIGLGRQLTPEWSVNAALRLEDVELKHPASPTPAVVAKEIGHNFLSTIRTSVTHDTRDMSIMPGEGHYGDLAWEQAFNDYNYSRVEGEFRQYYTLHSRPDGSGRHVLTLAGLLGWSDRDTPVFERYFAGGFQSFRGFSYRGVTPRSNGVATGGTFQMLGTVEYRIPVTADDMINFVAFTDFGSVEEEVTLNNFRASAGLGLRVVVPAMGPVPLAFDFAFPIASQDYDDQRIFSFYVGVNR
ncbi:MAG: BamA/TamA family outer membrane protein [Planctomycetaceae bacterium]|nr:BamA/TamA family outer membrane protein [Planctomycetaceae bacterium]